MPSIFRKDFTGKITLFSENKQGAFNKLIKINMVVWQYWLYEEVYFLRCR